MFMVVSPYHITTRELPAMGAFVLGEHITTMLPTPFTGDGRDQIDRAVHHVPRYLRLMESWRWATEVWGEGIVGSILSGEEPVADVRSICELIANDPAYAALRPLMRNELFQDEYSYLDLVGADLLKGGPDPGVSVPVAAGLDRFAMRHGLVVARSSATSVAQKAELRLGTRLFAMAIPLLRQGNGAAILRARALLAPELEHLRDLIHGVVDLIVTGDERHVDESSLREAGRAFSDGFERDREEITSVLDADDPRIVPTIVRVTGVMLPVDAVLRSSVAAMRAVASTVGALETDEMDGTDVVDTTLPVVLDPLVSGKVLTLVMHEVGGHAGRRRF